MKRQSLIDYQLSDILNNLGRVPVLYHFARFVEEIILKQWILWNYLLSFKEGPANDLACVRDIQLRHLVLSDEDLMNQ